MKKNKFEVVLDYVFLCYFVFISMILKINIDRFNRIIKVGLLMNRR